MCVGHSRKNSDAFDDAICTATLCFYASVLGILMKIFEFLEGYFKCSTASKLHRKQLLVLLNDCFLKPSSEFSTF